MFAQAENNPPPTFKEIAKGAKFTVGELRDATFKHVCTQLWMMQPVYKEYAQIDEKGVYTMPDQDALMEEEKKRALNPIDLVEFKEMGE